jgi:hypothetical protein
VGRFRLRVKGRRGRPSEHWHASRPREVPEVVIGAIGPNSSSFITRIIGTLRNTVGS